MTKPRKSYYSVPKEGISFEYKMQDVYDALHTPTSVFVGDPTHPSDFTDTACWEEGPPLTPQAIMDEYGLSRRQVNMVIQGTAYKKEITRWADNLPNTTTTEEKVLIREDAKDSKDTKLCPLIPTNARFQYFYNEEGKRIGRKDITARTNLKGCGRRLPLTAFSRDRTRRDGRAYYCKECFTQYAPKPAINGKRKDKQDLAEIGQKRCTVCLTAKEYAHFPKDKSRNDGYGNNCRPCAKAKRDARRKEN